MPQSIAFEEYLINHLINAQPTTLLDLNLTSFLYSDVLTGGERGEGGGISHQRMSMKCRIELVLEQES